MNDQAVGGCRLNHCITEKLKVFICGKNHLAIVTALDNVLRLTRDDIAGEPGHGTHRLVNGQSENSMDIVSDPI